MAADCVHSCEMGSWCEGWTCPDCGWTCDVGGPGTELEWRSMYRVTWSIDIDESEAETPEEAACYAYNIMRDPESTAVIFEVVDLEGETHLVDLDEED